MIYLDFKKKNEGMKVQKVFREANKGEWNGYKRWRVLEKKRIDLTNELNRVDELLVEQEWEQDSEQVVFKGGEENGWQRLLEYVE